MISLVNYFPQGLKFLQTPFSLIHIQEKKMKKKIQLTSKSRSNYSTTD